MIEILSENRDLKRQIKEAEKMLTEVDVTKRPSCELGFEAGIQARKLQGERLFLLRLLKRKLGVCSPEIKARIESADKAS